MKNFLISAGLVSIGLFAVYPAAAEPPVSAESPVAAIGAKAPDFSVPDSSGAPRTLAEFAGKIIVLEWVNFDCPFIRKHYDTGNMQRLQRQYTEKGVIWLSVNSSAKGKQGFFEGDLLRERITVEKSAATAYLTDTDGKVGRMYGAKTTPHMFIINASGILVYAGGIDDKPSTDKATVAGADNHVEKVLNALLDGNESPVRTSMPYGCSVKY